MSLARVDKHIQQGFLEDMPYDVANYLVDHAPCKITVPVGPWRGMHHSQNCFFKECFIDELAHAAHEDPYLYRLALLRGHPQADRLVGTLNAAASRAGWGSQLPSDIHRGIAMNETHGTYTAAVVEVSMRGHLRVHRVITAIDCGMAVNPLTIELQVESATIWALSAAMYGEITYQQGRVQQSNFDNYPVLRLSETPIIETVLVPSDGPFSGVGEPPAVAVAPALCNALFAATGKRIRSLPLKKHNLHI
jgi:isoquinoline 1-oxidoreductase subunit beta